MIWANEWGSPEGWVWCVGPTLRKVAAAVDAGRWLNRPIPLAGLVWVSGHGGHSGKVAAVDPGRLVVVREVPSVTTGMKGPPPVAYCSSPAVSRRRCR